MSKIAYAIHNSFTDEFYDYCTKEERYTTPLAYKYPLVFKPVKECFRCGEIIPKEKDMCDECHYSVYEEI